MAKRYFIIILLLIISTGFSYGQGGVWTWMKGSSTRNSMGNYGTKGVSAPTNNPPARHQATEWKDQDGNFWVFGGYGFAGALIGYYNDLWKYDVSTNEWTWINGPQLFSNMAGNFGTMGVSSPLNLPPARSHGFKWVDSLGNFYICGGSQGPFNGYNDIWRYEISNNEWTWVGGTNTINDVPVYGIKGVAAPTNTPGSRLTGTSTWKIGSEVYIFGSFTQQGAPRNDLWKLNLNNYQWTWIAGNNTSNPPSVFGVKGVASPNNVPSGRHSFTSWQDKDSIFIFAGNSGIQYNSVNQLWKFDLQSNQWTWLDGVQAINPPGLAQAVCQEDSINIPRGRLSNRTLNSINKCTPKMITFGGIYVNSINPFVAEYINDLWVYNNHTRIWKLIWGNTNGTAVPYNYGIKGVSATSNAIPARTDPCMWHDAEGNIWIFGGGANTNANGPHNDLWKFTPDTACLNINSASSEINFQIKDTSICKNETVNITFPQDANVGITPTINVAYDSINHSASFRPNAKETYTIRLTNNETHPCPFDTTISFTIDIIAPDIPSMNDTNICQGSSYQINFIPEANVQITSSGSFIYDQNNHSAIFNPTSSQLYSVNLKSNALAKCPFDTTITFKLDVIEPPTSNFEADLLCDDMASVVVKNNSTHAENYSWYLNGVSYSSNQQPSPIFIEEINQEDLCVSLAVSNHCFSDSSIFCIPSASTFILPNAFSPNGDGRNDVFRIKSIGGQNLDLQYFSVFNRWGQRIFHTYDWQKGWDGNYKGVPAEIGTYYFIIKVNEGSCSKDVKSNVTLVR